MKTQSWLWPDRTIGKAESRQLREEHNALVNSHAELLEALQRFISLCPNRDGLGGHAPIIAFSTAAQLARAAIAHATNP